ncbi:MAG: MarR family transcriptional regulator [Caulobacteraceae bacterium]
MDRDLHAALMKIVGMLNSPRYDDILLKEAGTALDRALFPLLVRVDAQGPIAVTELAEHVGRDHSTVSRQLAKLEALGLVSRQAQSQDRRVRAAVITADGRRVADRISKARDRLFERVLEGWTPDEREALTRLNVKLAEVMGRLGASADRRAP